MSILIGVQFLFIKSLIYKAFSTLFNDIRLCGTPKTVAAELFAFSPITPFNERSRGVHFRQKGCAHFNYSSRAQKKGRKTRSPQNANDLATDIVNIGLHFFLKDVRPMLPPVMNHSIAVA